MCMINSDGMKPGLAIFKISPQTNEQKEQVNEQKQQINLQIVVLDSCDHIEETTLTNLSLCILAWIQM